MFRVRSSPAAIISTHFVHDHSQHRPNAHAHVDCEYPLVSVCWKCVCVCVILFPEPAPGLRNGLRVDVSAQLHLPSVRPSVAVPAGIKLYQNSFSFPEKTKHQILVHCTWAKFSMFSTKLVSYSLNTSNQNSISTSRSFLINHGARVHQLQALWKLSSFS